ncbi:hypothetical protein GCM10010466_20250 [Planomonospora alba]|uniref:DivIVA domain-containing protein n=1 Tax=Planomonospora alba TaxID=161354 RepID=A0ABP6N0H9_9ACTN
MLVVLVLAALAILAGVVVVAMGRGGELTEFAPDVPPLALPDAGKLTAVDFMALQLPVSLVGYHTQSVDETLQRVAHALSERDTRIAVLEQRVSELLESRLQARHELHPGPSYGPAAGHAPESPGAAVHEDAGRTAPPAEAEPAAPEDTAREGTAVEDAVPQEADGSRDGPGSAAAHDDAVARDGAPGEEPGGGPAAPGGREDAGERG